MARRRADSSLPIEIGPVTVEFTVLARQETSGHAGVKFWVVDAGGSETKTGESTQKVTMVLQPLDPEGTGRARIADVDTPVRSGRGDIE